MVFLLILWFRVAFCNVTLLKLACIWANLHVFSTPEDVICKRSPEKVILIKLLQEVVIWITSAGVNVNLQVLKIHLRSPEHYSCPPEI